MTIGKYEREALEERRRRLLDQRRRSVYGLSPMEGRELDEIEAQLGPRPEVDGKGVSDGR